MKIVEKSLLIPKNKEKESLPLSIGRRKVRSYSGSEQGQGVATCCEKRKRIEVLPRVTS